MHIVATEREFHAESRKHAIFHVRLRVAIRVLKTPQARNIRPPDLVPTRDNPGRRSIERLAKSVGKDGALVRLAVSICVVERDDALLLRLERLFELRRVRIILPHHAKPVVSRPRGDIVVQPAHVAAVVHDASHDRLAVYLTPLLSVALAHVPAPAVIRRKRHRICEHRLECPDIEFQARIGADGFQRIRGVLRAGLRLSVSVFVHSENGSAETGQCTGNKGVFFHEIRRQYKAPNHRSLSILLQPSAKTFAESARGLTEKASKRWRAHQRSRWQRGGIPTSRHAPPNQHLS